MAEGKDVEHVSVDELSITKVLEEGNLVKVEDPFFGLLGMNDPERKERMLGVFDTIFNEKLGIGEDTEEA